MQAQGKDRSLLRDLALIYLTLAHGADQDLSRVEVEEISRRLSAWQTQATAETVLSAIKDALEDYTAEAARIEVDVAVRRVGAELDHERLSIIVDDLTEIAMSDDKFLHEESAFIGDLAREWEVHTAPDGDDEIPWSILNETPGRNGWSSLHDLALIYLYLAHGSDHDVDEREVDAISRSLREWVPDEDEDDVMKVVREAMHAYVQGPDRRLFGDSVESLKRAVPPHQRASLLDDLEQIATSDADVASEEKELIRKLSRAWDIETN
jgi:uncharacterized tellurite resistance protein B-like protein